MIALEILTQELSWTVRSNSDLVGVANMSEGRAAVYRADQILSVALGIVQDGVYDLEISGALAAQVLNLQQFTIS